MDLYIHSPIRRRNGVVLTSWTTLPLHQLQVL
jgi:hypothetical protein